MPVRRDQGNFADLCRGWQEYLECPGRLPFDLDLLFLASDLSVLAFDY